MSAANKLASIDAGAILPDTDPMVHKYQVIIDELRERCPAASEERVADVSVATFNLLKERGRPTPLDRVMVDVYASLPPGNSISLEEAMAAYATLRK